MVKEISLDRTSEVVKEMLQNVGSFSDLKPPTDYFVNALNKLLVILDSDSMLFYSFKDGLLDSDPLMIGNFTEEYSVLGNEFNKIVKRIEVEGLINRFFVRPMERSFRSRTGIEVTLGIHIGEEYWDRGDGGILFVNYHDEHAIDDYGWEKIASVSSLVINSLYKGVGVELVKRDLLQFQIGFPPRLSVVKYLELVSINLRAIESIYLIISIVAKNNGVLVRDFLSYFGVEIQPLDISSYVRSFAYSVNIEPLRLSKTSYGSPASFDLLGVGKMLEIVRDIIKDLVWRSKHEKIVAELKRGDMMAEMKRKDVETEEIAIEVASQKLTVLESINSLQLTKDERNKVIEVLIPEMSQIGYSASSNSLEDRHA